MRFLNRAENPNALAGIALLILLAVFAGPTVFPEVIKNTFSFIDATEGPPCYTLRDGSDRSNHQSLIGRAVSTEIESPLELTVRTSAAAEGAKVTIVVTNQTLGTVPILVIEDRIITDPNLPENGFGIVISSTAPVPNVGENINSYPESRIKLMGPRQVCVHEATLGSNQLPPQFVTADATIKAFYRNSVRGTAIANGTNPVIYADQGLWTGVVESPVINVTASVQ